MALTEKLTAIADAIREQTGGTESLTLDGMVNEINNNISGLNFTVVGSTSTPSNPIENMIWVNTDAGITSWIFSAKQPTGTEGMVWIATETYNTVSFNALKKNSIMVYPLSAKQYVSGAWIGKTAKIYQNGTWVDWWNGQLFENGNHFEEITGGWVARNGNYEKITFSDTEIVFTRTGSSDRYATAYTANKINLTNFSELIVDVYFPIIDEDRELFVIGITDYNTDNEHEELGEDFLAMDTVSVESGQHEMRVDISDFQSSHYIALYAEYYANAYVTSVRLE